MATIASGAQTTTVRAYTRNGRIVRSFVRRVGRRGPTIRRKSNFPRHGAGTAYPLSEQQRRFLFASGKIGAAKKTALMRKRPY